MRRNEMQLQGTFESREDAACRGEVRATLARALEDNVAVDANVSFTWTGEYNPGTSMAVDVVVTKRGRRLHIVLSDAPSMANMMARMAGMALHHASVGRDGSMHFEYTLNMPADSGVVTLHPV